MPLGPDCMTAHLLMPPSVRHKFKLVPKRKVVEFEVFQMHVSFTTRDVAQIHNGHCRFYIVPVQTKVVLQRDRFGRSALPLILKSHSEHVHNSQHQRRRNSCKECGGYLAQEIHRKECTPSYEHGKPRGASEGGSTKAASKSGGAAKKHKRGKEEGGGVAGGGIRVGDEQPPRPARVDPARDMLRAALMQRMAHSLANSASAEPPPPQ